MLPEIFMVNYKIKKKQQYRALGNTVKCQLKKKNG